MYLAAELSKKVQILLHIMAEFFVNLASNVFQILFVALV